MTIVSHAFHHLLSPPHLCSIMHLTINQYSIQKISEILSWLLRCKYTIIFLLPKYFFKKRTEYYTGGQSDDYSLIRYVPYGCGIWDSWVGRPVALTPSCGIPAPYFRDGKYTGISEAHGMT